MQGAQWVRADFHLHTRADREFKYTGDDNFYNSNYVDTLEKAGIRLGVITNHNKFDFDEFKALRKTARKRDIALLPGIELSVGDANNGIHTLVVFSDDWLVDGHDHINPFLSVAFEGKIPAQYEQENGRSSLSLLETIKKLESYHRDFFLSLPMSKSPVDFGPNWAADAFPNWVKTSSFGAALSVSRRFVPTTSRKKEINPAGLRFSNISMIGTPPNWKAATQSA